MSRVVVGGLALDTIETPSARTGLTDAHAAGRAAMLYVRRDELERRVQELRRRKIDIGEGQYAHVDA